ncbi:hypothetical protein M9978_12320 [Sphingomonas sp. MG17]|jgi:hypothetical protein|uniref:Lipoprotein n=1 Tax=Sphingomonas tagetis TaxID=2949092 RepID=A0A9X2HK67_9SPHN|nr:hypothetical protein [Sphingomonas tagetis]MCP3731212.1 hypothetical protein [Sphingomonas tagetis]
MRFALLLLPALALAGCGGTAPGNAAGAENVVAAENVAAPAAETRGWDELFAKPASEAIAIFEKLSLRPGAYEVMGDMHMSHGAPISLADTAAGKKNTLAFTASGDASQLQGVSFDVVIEDQAQAEASRQRALESIGNVLRVAGLDGEAVVKAALTADAKPATGKVAGANYAVLRKDARTTINFTKQSN